MIKEVLLLREGVLFVAMLEVIMVQFDVAHCDLLSGNAVRNISVIVEFSV